MRFVISIMVNYLWGPKMDYRVALGAFDAL
jgi:hypothetical protein